MSSIQIGYSSDDIKEALRRRHPAYEPGFVGVGRWTCVEEWQDIDLLALDAWRAGSVIGYEIKVSRSDMRTELLKPEKRAKAVAMCTRFYFAVPAGMLTYEEKRFQEPSWTTDDFERARCSGVPAFGPPGKHRQNSSDSRYGGPCVGTVAKGSRFGRKRVQPYTIEVPVPVIISIPRLRDHGRIPCEVVIATAIQRETERRGSIRIPCPTCVGRGYIAKSRVELEAPTLWVPNDVGLIEVDGRGCTITREAPGRAVTEPIIPWPYVGVARLTDDPELHEADRCTAARIQRQAINQLVRWVSARPDPRHRPIYSDKIKP